MNRKFMGLAASLVVALWLPGCGSSEEAPQPSPQTKVDPKTPKTDSPSPDKSPQETPKKPDPSELWAKITGELESQLDEDNLEAAAASLTALKDVYGDEGPADAEQQAQLESFQIQLADKQRVVAQRMREEQLQSARELMDQGKFDESIRQLENVLARSPTDDQRKLAGQLKREIEYRRKTLRTLGALRKLLGSELRTEVQSAQLQLRKEPDTAIPLLIEWSGRAEDSRLVKNALETMRRIKRPALALPAMLSVLSRKEQQANWNDAVAAIVGADSPGIGPDLLKLIANTENAEQRAAALAALSDVPDPPEETLIALLPFVLKDGPDLTQALQALFSAIVVHDQYDLPALRGIEAELSDQQQQQLAALPARLDALIARAKDNPGAPEAHAARILAIATRQRPAEPLTGVTVIGSSDETETNRKASLLDGIWNAVELESMWYQPVTKQPATIILDLGEERTVVGVRIWNFNELNAGYRGWKEVDVYVSNIKSELTPTSNGIVPPAPGVADPPDYSTVLPVEFVRGRYVKLKSKSIWRSSSYFGLSEIQVLGF